MYSECMMKITIFFNESNNNRPVNKNLFESTKLDP